MNTLGLNGAQPQKPTRFSPIYTGRFFSGIWTNRSPLRDANTTRLVEKFYGASGDALIAGSNVEVTNRLTLARRPGNPQFDSVNTYTSVDSFDNFRMFGPNIEQINVMIDEANSLSSLFNNVKTTVWNKTTGAGQSFMQSVGNSLYFGNGMDNKKWLQSLFSWSANAQWNGPTTPFMSTFLVDPNGNIQQLTSTIVPVTSTQVTSNVLTVTSSQTLTNVLSTDLQITFPSGMASAFLDGQTVTVASVGTNTFTATFVHANAGPTAESGIKAVVKAGGTPISGSVQPTWSIIPLTPGMATPSQALTDDGTVRWTNRGTTVQNWGIVAPQKSPTVTVGSSRSAWRANTFFSLPGVIIDSNGNLQQVTVEGKSGSSAPTWATLVGNTTTDGTVTWTMIQTAASMVWQAHTTYAPGHFIIGNAAGTNCLFKLSAITTPTFSGALAGAGYNTGDSDQFRITFPNPAPDFTLVPPSMWLPDSPAPLQFNILNGAGEVTGQYSTGHHSRFAAIWYGTLQIRVAGQYSFQLAHDNAGFLSIGDGAQLVAGIFNDPRNLIVPVKSPHFGFTQLAGDNSGNAGTDTSTWNFPAAGTYRFEVDWCNNEGAGFMHLTVNGQDIVPGPDESGATEPVWPAWTTIYAPNYPTVSEAAGQYVWQNLGPAVDFAWSANINFTLPNTTIIDPAGNTEGPYRTGITGTTQPTFATGLFQLTNDNPNLIWINQGAASAPPPGTVSTFLGGWKYAIALVNTLDNTVSNCSPLTPATGNFIGATGVEFAAGSGLGDPAKIDPQADYVAIFRTTDGQANPVFLINGTLNSIYTVSLADYLANGYTDTATDEDLNNLISGAIAGENTPPAAGAVNLTFHLNRIFFSVGNVVYWTSGPSTPVGNGVNGVAPLNFDEFPSLVKRIVPTAIGALVFTVSDIYLITGQGTASSPIQNGSPFLQGIGILSYNALAICGSVIGLFTTDKQFIILDPTSGVSYCGFPIGDQFRQNTGNPGTAWDASNVYVAWHVSGEDQAWYVADGQFGWYRLMATPAPETGYTWSPFATIVGGVKAVKSIEVSPGVHKLLLGPTATGHILNRDLNVFQDNGSNYTANATLGSMVLANPGQMAEVSFITTDTVRVGSPLVLGIIVDEALPYFTGQFETLKNWTNDPPNQPESRSILGQRFYLSDTTDQAALCRHLQLRVDWLAENVQNELLTLTIYGAYLQEL